MILICDTGNVAIGTPTLTTSLRGVVNVRVTVETLASRVHSGQFGGAAPDALAALIAGLASLRDADGDTTIDGLDATGTFDGAPYDPATFRSDATVLDGVDLVGSAPPADMVWARPAVTVIGIDAPSTQNAASAITPRAAAVLNLRVPPGIDPARARDALEAHLRAHIPWNARVTVEPEAAGAPFAADTSGPGYRALTAAMEEAYGAPVVRSGQGGSIPLCTVLSEICPDAEIALLGVEEPRCRIHAADESVDPDEIARTACRRRCSCGDSARAAPPRERTRPPVGARRDPSPGRGARTAGRGVDHTTRPRTGRPRRRPGPSGRRRRPRRDLVAGLRQLRDGRVRRAVRGRDGRRRRRPRPTARRRRHPGRADGSVDAGPGHGAPHHDGAPMPDGADAVVQVEYTDGGTGTVAVRRAVDAGASVRRAGSDITAGDLALPAGTVLNAPQIGLLAALGIAEVTVPARPHVVVLSTGSELVAAGKPLQHGQIHESNGAMLCAAVTAAGARATALHFVPDDVEEFRAHLDAVVDSADPPDLVLTSGGVSAGAYEVVKDALVRDDVEFVKVAMQPGMPQGSGRYTTASGRAVPIVTLPGNPVSAQVSFEVFVRPPLRDAVRLPRERPRATAVLADDLRSPRGKRQFRRGVVETAPDGTVRVHPIGRRRRTTCGTWPRRTR